MTEHGTHLPDDYELEEWGMIEDELAGEIIYGDFEEDFEEVV